MTASLPTRLLALAGILCLLMTGAQPCFATEEDSEKKPEKAANIDFNDIEGIGLIQKAGEGALGKDLWSGSRRSELVKLIEAMPAASPQPGVQKLIAGILLSQTSAGSIKNDVPPEAGRDLLTLRLEKLLQGGSYKNAFDLYSKLESEPYHENLARAGILAMLFNGQKSLACLEANSVHESFPESEFLNELGAYCDVTLSDAGNPATSLESSPHKLLATLATKPEFRFAYTPEAFESLNIIERAVLASENRLDISGADLSAVPAAHLQILLHDENLDPKARFALTARAVEWGLAPVEDLTVIYDPLTAEKHADPVPPPEGKLPEDDIGKLSVLYRRAAWAKEDDEKWQIARQALPVAEKLGPVVLTPFAQFMQNPPEQPNPAETAEVFKIFDAAGQKIPKKWLDSAANTDQQGIDNNTYSLLLAATSVAKPELLKNDSFRTNLSNSLKATEINTHELVNNIIENVDKPSGDNDNANVAYENEYYLTFSGDYVMPSVLVWDRVKEASQAKATGETILLNTVLLSDRAVQQIYPGLLRDILQGFDKVGLTNVSQDLAISACLGNIN